MRQEEHKEYEVQCIAAKEVRLEKKRKYKDSMGVNVVIISN